jgi:hypothetical protein
MDDFIISACTFLGASLIAIVLLTLIALLVGFTLKFVSECVWARNKWMFMNFHFMMEAGPGKTSVGRLKACFRGPRMVGQLQLIRDVADDVLNEISKKDKNK